ncbi:MAG: 50S ribosomal protein L24 [Chloroflexi bacterium]|nr:50S ribosomal protein L24 [Chloroflexota bacterium]
MQGARIRKGDEVVVLAGKDRGKRGKVEEVRPGVGVTVVGLNIVKRHTRANPAKNEKGGIVEKPAPLAIGKVMIVCPQCGKPARVGHRTADESKERFCKRCGEAIVSPEKE